MLSNGWEILARTSRVYRRHGRTSLRSRLNTYYASFPGEGGMGVCAFEIEKSVHARSGLHPVGKPGGFVGVKRRAFEQSGVKRKQKGTLSFLGHKPTRRDGPEALPLKTVSNFFYAPKPSTTLHTEKPQSCSARRLSASSISSLGISLHRLCVCYVVQCPVAKMPPGLHLSSFLSLMSPRQTSKYT